ncbi:phage tail tape measure protein [Methylobacterium aerolatum]|uniref:TP901 family phage tail tape measure protein n=1 Tax=Methylobacterium aerolatum TaxID=418708 RepID=A0ABU0I2C1_9HYPH|nr:phage tail tape measure protein [Methylobacterium aerolatum]MDQ0448060.1 TP901 family phage tail tape measure protein [Methylobacterium aerolatum]GJD36469.1 hypothetical protein FMGBMHLM_3389 [Methylobacterium aerolatum]
MSETTELKAVVSVEDRGSTKLRQIGKELDALTAKMRAAAEAMTGKMSGFGADIAKGQDRANDAVRRGLGLQAQAERHRAGTAKAQRDDANALDSATVRSFKMQMRMQREQAREAAVSDRARETAARAQAREAERASRAVEAAAIRRARVEANETRRRDREARAADRDRERAEIRQARDNEAAARRAIGLDNYRFNLRERYRRQEAAETEKHHRDTIRQGREAWSRGRDGMMGVARPAAAVAAVGVGGAVAATRRVLRAETDLDSAEIGTRQYGGLDAKSARDLRDQWAAPTAEALGVPASKLMESWTDATKLGIPAKDAKGFAELATKTSEAWGVPFQTVVDTLGTMNTLLTAKGEAFDLGKLTSAANAMQHLAAKQSTTPEKLISFLARGAGGGDLLGMSMEGTVAFGSASTSLGNQAGASGSLLDYIAGRVIEMPKLTHQKGREGDQARQLMRSLGYGTGENMERIRRADPDAFLPDLFERFNKIQDPKKRNEAIRFFTGREWLGEFGRMVNGPETYREAQKLAKESKSLDAIGEVWTLHKLKLTFVAKQFGAGWMNILGEFGKVISPMAREAGDFFLEWTGKLRQGGLRDRFKALLDGLLEGLGVKSLPDLLRNLFGDPKDATGGNVEAWKAAAKGFGEGIRDVVGSILGVAKMFTGGDSNPEKLGRLTAQVLGFGMALVVIAPFVSVIGAMGSALLGLAFAAGAAWKVMKGLGVVGGAAGAGVGAGAAGAAAGAVGAKGGKLAALGRLFGLYGLADAANEYGALKAPDTSKGIGQALVEALDPGLASRIYGDGGGAEAKPPSNPMADLEDIRKSLAARDPELARKLFPNGAVVQPQSLTDGDWRGLIQPANLSGDVGGAREWREHGQDLGDGFLDRARRGLGVRDGAPDRTSVAVDDLRREMNRLGNRTRLGGLDPALTGAAASAFGGGSGGYGSGSPIDPNDPAQKYGKRYFTVPGGIGSGPGTAARGALAANQQEAFKAAREAGLSETAARALVANMSGESLANPRDHHWDRTHMSQGIVQWDPQRAERIRAQFGKLPKDMTVSEQTRAAIWEMKTRPEYAPTWRALQGNDPGEMIGALVRNYERPADKERAIRERFGHYRGFTPNGAGGTVAGREQFEGLRLKSFEAIAGGAVAQGVTDLARQAQDDLPGGVARFTAFNDRYHQGTGSKHAAGLAFDTVLKDASRSQEAATAMRAKLAAAGLDASQYRVIDEYLNPSSRSTGGHIHTQFNTAEAAQRYHDYLGASGALAEKAKAGRGKSVIAEDDAAPPSEAARAMIRKVPAPPPRPAGIGGGSGGAAGSSFHIHQTIHGYDKSPAEIAAMSQRHISETWEHQANDMMPETV